MDFQLECPHCKEMIQIKMEYHDRDSKKNPLSEILGFLSPDLENYSWTGEGKCTCGKHYTAQFSVEEVGSFTRVFG